MVLSNYCAARFAMNNHIPMVYRVQRSPGGEPGIQRPRLSVYPEFHTGVGLDCYSQLSSPIRRYMDLVLQRQILCALSDGHANVYEAEQLLPLLANAENTESEGREL